ncbi:MAG: RnfH family protein [Gammaproteobacteria bacterium]
MEDAERMTVEVAFALPREQVILEIDVAPDATVRQAIDQSGILERFPQIDLDGATKVGIFGKLTKLDAGLRPGDRVEIYRELIADPKEVRRKRAAEGKVMKKNAGTGGEEADSG